MLPLLTHEWKWEWKKKSKTINILLSSADLNVISVKLWVYGYE